MTSVLEMAKIESGSYEIHPESIDLPMLIRDCIAMTSVLLERKALAITCKFADDCRAWCDPMRTRQALLNILSNASKYTDDFGTLTVTAGPGAAGDIVVTIADTGIGMTEDDLITAMAPFAQVSSGNTKAYGGTGLGLPLTKRLIEIQGGRFAIHSVKDEGTTVTFMLPAAKTDG